MEFEINLGVAALVLLYLYGTYWWLNAYREDPTMLAKHPVFWQHVVAVIILLLWPITVVIGLIINKYMENK
jgi:hypothetical protein